MFGTKTGRKATLVGVALILAGSAVAQEKSGPHRYRTLTPCRVFDTRDSSGSPLSNPGPHGFTIRRKCGVPESAVAVAVNITITGPTQAGDLRVYPKGTTPTASTLNFAAGEPALANGAIVPLGAASYGDDIEIAVGMAANPYTGSVHVLLDVAGYFE